MSYAANVNPLVPRRKIKSRISDDPLSLARAYEQSKRSEGEASPRTLWFFRDEFYSWNAGAYRALPVDRVHRDLYRFLDNRNIVGKDGNKPCKPNEKIVRDVVAALKAVCELFADNVPSWIDPEGYAINGPIATDNVLAFKNGILDLGAYLADGDVTLHPLTPGWFSTQVFPYDFTPGARCPTWLQFLNQSLVGDHDRISLLQEWFGYCLTRDLSRQKIMIMIGLGGAGKGTILQVLKAIVNEANVAAPSLDDLADNFGLEGLLGKTVALIGETNVGRQTDARKVLDRLKRISGGDPVDVNRKHLRRLNGVQLGVRFTIAGNEPFPMPDASNGITRRLLGLRFERTAEGNEDTGLLPKLIAELSGIMLWSIEGLARLQEQRGFTKPEDSIALVQEVARLTSPVRTFVDEQLIVAGTPEAAGLSEEELETPSDQVWERWRWYAKKYGFKEGTSTGLGMRLNTMLTHLNKARAGSRENRFNVYRGIKLRPNADANSFGASASSHGTHSNYQTQEDPLLDGL